MGADIEHGGIVRSVADGRAVIAVETGGCSGCGHLSGCGMGQLAGKRSQTLITLAVDAAVRPGARVRLSLSARRVGQGALLGYFLPAVAMVGGAAVGAGWFGSDAAAAAGLALGLGAGLALTRAVAARLTAPQVSLLPEEAPGNPQFRLRSAAGNMPNPVEPKVREITAP